MKEKTKTEGTIAEYTSRVITMAKRIKCSHDSPEFPEALLNQLKAEKPSISKATWRKKKASLLYYFEQVGREDLIQELGVLGSDGSLTKSSNTSATKKKSLTELEESIIRKELESQSKNVTTWGRQLLAYTECILITGMRPIELQDARIYDSEAQFINAGFEPSAYSGNWPILHIHNGKQTNGRSFGEKRHVDLSELDQKQLLLIKIALMYAQQLESPNGQAESYEKFYNSLRMAFARVVGKLFSGRSATISLYTYRHQCIANMKHDDSFTLLDIAAIVGHGNDLTATEHYGRKRHGRSRGGKVKANPTDVAKVRPLIDRKMQKFLSQKPSPIN